jgi:hypothetical protein
MARAGRFSRRGTGGNIAHKIYIKRAAEAIEKLLPPLNFSDLSSTLLQKK